MDIVTIEDKLIEVITTLGIFATVQSAGRKELPPTYAYPACFVFFDGDKAIATVPRPIDELTFAVAIQVQNMSMERSAAHSAYTINELVRAAIRSKYLGLVDIEPFTCASRLCTGYDDSDGVIEYTHIYNTRLYHPVSIE